MNCYVHIFRFKQPLSLPVQQLSNLVQIIDNFPFEENHFIVTPLIGAESISNLFLLNLNESAIRVIFFKILSALQIFHQNHFVYSALHPNNILLTKNGSILFHFFEHSCRYFRSISLTPVLETFFQVGSILNEFLISQRSDQLSSFIKLLLTNNESITFDSVLSHSFFSLIPNVLKSTSQFQRLSVETKVKFIPHQENFRENILLSVPWNQDSSHFILSFSQRLQVQNWESINILSEDFTPVNKESFVILDDFHKILLHSSIHSIGHLCFWDLKNLKIIIFSNSVKSLCDDCFSGCLSLISLTIPNSVTYLGDDCFSVF
jgi:hypothetical protein